MATLANRRRRLSTAAIGCQQHLRRRRRRQYHPNPTHSDDRRSKFLPLPNKSDDLASQFSDECSARQSPCTGQLVATSRTTRASNETPLGAPNTKEEEEEKIQEECDCITKTACSPEAPDECISTASSSSSNRIADGATFACQSGLPAECHEKMKQPERRSSNSIEPNHSAPICALVQTKSGLSSSGLSSARAVAAFKEKGKSRRRCDLMAMIDWQTKEGPCCATSGRLLFVSWLAVVFLSLWGQASGDSYGLAAPEAGGKFEYWRRLVQPLLTEDQLESSQALDRLASKLSDWPSQKQAAIFYLDLLARSTANGIGGASAGASVDDDESNQRRAESRRCKRVNLAQLTQATDRFEQNQYSHDADDEQVNELQILAKLQREQPFVQAAKLALENANLISRLLIHPESDAIRHIATHKFAKHLLELRLNQTTAPFVEFGAKLKWNSSSTSGGGTWGQPFHSSGLVFVGPPAAAGPDSKRQAFDVSFAPLAFVDETKATVDLKEQLLSSRRRPGFVEHWIRLASGQTTTGELSGLQERLAESLLAASVVGANDKQAQLNRNDGRWFGPTFECNEFDGENDQQRRWLLSFSVPFFGANSQGRISFRGVSFVNLNLAKLNLVNQCASEEDGFFLAASHNCHKIVGSQCVPIPPSNSNSNSNQIRPLGGSYVCQCPTGRSYLEKADAIAMEQMRAQLGEKIVQLAASNVSHSLDQLSLELSAPSPFQDDQESLAVLAQHQAPSSSSSSFLVPGFQLNSDAALEWFSGQTFVELRKCKMCSNQATNQTAETQNKQAALHHSTQDPSIITCDQTAQSAASSSSSSHLDRRFEGDPEREEQQQELKSLVAFIVLVIQGVCVIWVLALFAILLKLRKSRIILVSGWLMLEAMLVGALLLYLSVFVYYFHASSLSCLLEPWLRELGFSVFYGAILIKLYRILTEFQTRKAHRVCFRDKDQVICLLAIVLIVVGYMSAWTALMADSRGFVNSARSGPILGQQKSLDEVQNSAADLMDSSKQFSSASSLSSASVGQESDFYHAQEVAESSTSSWISSWTYAAAAKLPLLTIDLKSFNDLFSGLLESEYFYDATTNHLRLSFSCRRLTWDYVTELSEMALILFGVHLIYKLRNSGSDVHKEKPFLCAAVFLELLVSTCVYLTRHLLWPRLAQRHLLLLYCVRYQLTVTLSLVLVLGPKLWEIHKSSSGLFNSAAAGARSGGSARHRCHISCELHDHHLNDAMRLHQAMLSNAALDIGSINLADMDPDEIQAELKRVYTQLEVLKTKVMRRDNPHISKRRGGRKSAHRKFSLQAFHSSKHSSSSQPTPSATNSTPTLAPTGQSGAQVAFAADMQDEDQHQLQPTLHRLPALAEQSSECQDGRSTLAEGAQSHATPLATRASSRLANRSYAPSDAPSSKLTNSTTRSALKGSKSRATNPPSLDHPCNSSNSNSNSNRPHNNNNTNDNTNNNKRQAAKRRSVILADPTSTTSSVYFDDDTLILNDSQSSDGGGRVSPQRQSSFAPECSQSSSIHPEDSSLGT